MTRSAFTDGYKHMLTILVRLRKEAGMTQAALSAKLGRGQPLISLVERGTRRIDVVEFYVIVKALDADPVAVFTELVQSMPKDGVI